MTSRPPSVRRQAVALTVGVTVALAACGGGDDAPALVVEQGIAVTDAWVRPTPPVSDEAAIYVSLENRSAADTAMLGATSDRCLTILPHVTAIDDAGVASMGGALDEQLALPTGGDVAMAPNGLHLMCLGLDRPLTAGDTFTLDVQLADLDPIAVVVTVEQR